MCTNVCGACVCVRAYIFTGEGEGVRGVMLQSFLDVAGEDGADKLSPKNERKKKGRRREIKLECNTQRWLTIKISL